MSDNIPQPKQQQVVSETTLIKAQAYSGLMIGVYLTMHLTNIALATAGPTTFNLTMTVMREIYQNPIFEIPLVLSIPVHLVSSYARKNRREAREKEASTTQTKKELTPQEKQLNYHRIAAQYLSVTIFSHFAGTRIMSIMSGILPSYSYLSLTMQFPSNVIFLPYYILLGMAGSYHFMSGVFYAFRNLGKRKWLPASADRIAHYTGVTVGAVAVGALFAIVMVPDRSAWAAWNAFFKPFYRAVGLSSLAAYK